MAEGDIGAVIDSLEYDTDLGAYCSIIHISGDVYAIAYASTGLVGKVVTVTIEGDGQVGAAVIDTLTFDAGFGAFARIIHISGDVYAIVYQGPDNDGWLCTVTIESDGQIGAAVIDTLEFETGICQYPRIIHISGDVYAIAYQGVDSDGWLCTVTIESDGQIGAAVIDTLEFDHTQGIAPCIIHISGDVYAVSYQGPDGDGWLCTVTIESDGQIGAAVIDTLEFDHTQGVDPCIIHISGDVYAIAYYAALGGPGMLKTVTIRSNGQILAAIIDFLIFDATDCSNPVIIHVSGDVYAIAYEGGDKDGWLCTVTIETNGQIGAAVIDTLEFDTDEGRWVDMIHISGSVYAIPYAGPGNDGWLKTVPIETVVVVAPTATTDPATVVVATSATLNGTLDDDGGIACDCGFEWGETVFYGNTTPTQSRTTGQTFAQAIAGLDPNKTYHFRAFATNGAGTSYGADRTFTTPVGLATVTTDPATGVVTNAATPNGTLDNDGGEACDCGFEWGETIAYGNTTPTQSRTTGQTFAQALAGLDPNKTYHFRALATNAAGPSYGTDRTFVTSAALPTVTTDPITDTSTLNGILTDDGEQACDCGFEWGETIAYEHGATPTQSKTTGQTFSQILGGLVPGTTYHYRAFATNGAGTSYGADRSFALPAGLPTATTNPATGIGMILAALNGTLDDDGGEICECGFEWGADTTYGLTTPTESKITGETFSQPIRGLFPGRVYHFRAFATNPHGTAYGDDESFYSKPSVSRAYALAREEL